MFRGGGAVDVVVEVVTVRVCLRERCRWWRVMLAWMVRMVMLAVPPPTWVPVLPVGPGCAVAPAPCVVRGVGVVAMRFLVVVVSGGDIVRRDGGVLGVEAPLP